MKKHIYGLIDPITQEMKYIGQSQAPKKRLIAHISEAKHHAGSNRKNHWLRSLLVKGLLPSLKILIECECSDATFYEKELIEAYKSTLVNTAPGGIGGGGLFGRDNQQSHPVALFDKGVFVRNFETMTDCAKYLGITRTNVKDAFYHRNIIGKRYQVMNVDLEFEDYSYYVPKGSDSPCAKTIEISENGRVVKVIRSVSEAAEYLGSTKGSIKMAARCGSLHKKRYRLKYVS